jgi:hypothetical protein
MSQARADGFVSIRPLRVGLVFCPSLRSFSDAVALATSSWGGLHFPFIDPTDEKHALAVSDRLGVDVLYAVDSDPRSQELSRRPGYAWTTGGDWGPFGPSGYFPAHVQGLDWVYDEDPNFSRFSHYHWEAEHPLNWVFSALYGRFGEDDFSRAAAESFSRRAHPTDAVEMLSEFGRWPYDPEFCSAISLTSKEIEYAGDGPGAGIVVIDADDPVGLCSFWNLRAVGGTVIPWINRRESVSLRSFELWLERALAKGKISRAMRASGERTAPILHVYVPHPDEMPIQIEGVAAKAGVEIWQSYRDDIPVRGWRGVHPFHTDFTRVFDIEVSKNGDFRIPLPHLGEARWKRKHQPGYIAADISFSSTRDLSPDMTLVMPQRRELSELVPSRFSTDQRSCRPIDDGFTIAVRSDAEFAHLSPVLSMDVIKALAQEPGWSYQQTDSGLFASRLIEKLGGRFSGVANQPAVRAVLSMAANSHHGISIASLLGRAKNVRGGWPHGAMSSAPEQYVRDVVYYLLKRKVLNPVLPVRCPNCSAEASVRPEDLKSEHSCGLCGEQTPLGFAIATRKKNDWLYRLASEIAPERLTETLPLMAVMSSLSAAARSGSYPAVLGVEVASPSASFEIDVAMILSGDFLPKMVVGEVKSYRDDITAGDIEHLCMMQKLLRAKEVDCYILAATFKKVLAPETILALRDACENMPTSLGSLITPVLPIVLTEPNLSAPHQSEADPSSWKNAWGGGLAELAEESCRRNIGLRSVELVHKSNGYGWKFEWDEV